MKRTLSLLLILVMLLASAATLMTSCGSDDEDEVGAGIHLFLSGRLYDFDPTGALIDDELMQVLSLMYEPLFTLKADGTVVGALAEDYEIDKTAHKMTITLRKTNWSDSKPVTSNDVIFAWQRILSPDFESVAAPMLYDIKNAVYVKQGGDPSGKTLTIADLGLEAPDNETLVITFRGDVDYDAFLRNLTSVALAPIPENTVSNALQADNWSKRVATIVTNGAFTLKSLDYQAGEFILQRNQYYRRDKNSDSALTEYVLPQYLTTKWQTEDMTAAEYEEFLNQEIVVHYAGTQGAYADSVYYMSDLPLALRKADTYAANIKKKDLMSVSSCVLNTKYGNPALANKNIRQALSYALNRQAIADELVYAKPADAFITEGVYEANKVGTSFRAKGGALISPAAYPKQASDLIAVGMTELGMTDKAELGELRVMYSGDSLNDAYMATALKTAWESLGFTVVLEPLYGEQRIVGEDVIVLDSVLQKNFNAQWTDIRLNEADLKTGANESGEAAPETPVDLYADVILVDYQMLSTDAFVPLCGFSSTMSGNGFDKTDVEGNREYSYSPVPHVSGYVNKSYDALIDQAYTATDAQKRASLLHQAEKMLLEDMPIIPLVYNQDFYVIDNKLEDVTANAYGYPAFIKANLVDYKELTKWQKQESDAE